MTRRTALPGAAELFRSTGAGRPGEQPASEPTSPTTDLVAFVATSRAQARDAVDAAVPLALAAPPGGDPAAQDDELAWGSPRPARRRARPLADRRPTGRERHDEKITVYVSAEELLDLEHARLALRGDHGLPVDRGRVVREALAVVLADFEAKGDASVLVRRLRGR